VSSGGVLRLVADLEPFASSCGETVESGREHGAGESTLLKRPLRPHRLDEPDAGVRVGPEQPVGRNCPIAVLYSQVEIGPVQGAFGEALPDRVPAAGDHVVRSIANLGTAFQPVTSRR